MMRSKKGDELYDETLITATRLENYVVNDAVPVIETNDKAYEIFDNDSNNFLRVNLDTTKLANKLYDSDIKFIVGTDDARSNIKSESKIINDPNVIMTSDVLPELPAAMFTDVLEFKNSNLSPSRSNSPVSDICDRVSVSSIVSCLRSGSISPMDSISDQSMNSLENWIGLTNGAEEYSNGAMDSYLDIELNADSFQWANDVQMDIESVSDSYETNPFPSTLSESQSVPYYDSHRSSIQAITVNAVDHNTASSYVSYGFNSSSKSNGVTDSTYPHNTSSSQMSTSSCFQSSNGSISRCSAFTISSAAAFCGFKKDS
jgi:hypothetical protein